MDNARTRAAVMDLIEGLDTLREQATVLLQEIDGTRTSVDLGRQGIWTMEQVEAFWEGVKHLPGACAMLEITAEEPGQQVTFRRLTERSGLSDEQQRNEHARMSRVSAKLFGAKRWPIENWQSSSINASGKAEMIYKMNPTIARWWREIVDRGTHTA